MIYQIVGETIVTDQVIKTLCSYNIGENIEYGKLWTTISMLITLIIQRVHYIQCIFYSDGDHSGTTHKLIGTTTPRSSTHRNRKKDGKIPSVRSTSTTDHTSTLTTEISTEMSTSAEPDNESK